MLDHHRLTDGINVGFTSVAAGNLALHLFDSEAHTASERDVAVQNRLELERGLGVVEGSTAYLHQVHSARVVDSSGLGWGGDVRQAAVEADAMISSDGTTPLAIMVADCVPVVFTSSTGATAVAHAGRAGLSHGVLNHTVSRMRQLPCGESAQLRAWIGPAICGACYEVPSQMRDEVGAVLPAARSITRWGSAGLDLPAAAEELLAEQKVTVHRSPVCTYEDHRLFSHRRAPGEGRNAGLVWRVTGE